MCHHCRKCMYQQCHICIILHILMSSYDILIWANGDDHMSKLMVIITSICYSGQSPLFLPSYIHDLHKTLLTTHRALITWGPFLSWDLGKINWVYAAFLLKYISIVGACGLVDRAWDSRSVPAAGHVQKCLAKFLFYIASSCVCVLCQGN